MDTNTTDKSDRYFRTSSFYISCFLLAKNQVLVNVDKTDPRKAVFVFLDSPEREFLVHSFNFATENASEVMIDVRIFVTAIKQLKGALFQD